MSGDILYACKTSGNSYFEQKEYIQCLAEYTKGINWYLEGQAIHQIEKEDEIQIKNIFNNRSLVYYRMGHYWEAAEDAKYALEIDGQHEKSLYRRALALVMYIHEKVWKSNIWCTHDLGDELQPCLGEARQCLLSLQKDANRSVSGDVAEFLAQVTILHDLGNHTNDENVECLVQILMDDVDGNDDVDVEETLEDLIETVNSGGVSASVTLLRATQGFRLLWYFMNDANAPQICRLLEAASASCVLWPRDAWGYLVDHACACKGSTEFSSLCMAALFDITQANQWVKLHLFTRTWNDNGSLIQNIITTIGSCHLARNCIGTDAVVLGCNIISGYGNISSNGSNGISKATNGFNTIIKLFDAFENADEIVKNSRHLEEAKDHGLQEIEAKAKEELIKKRDAIYNPSVVDLRKQVLACIRKLCSDGQFVIEEFVEWKNGKKCASQLHHRFISVGKILVHNCPKCTKKVLDMNLNPVSYKKKPYAADFIDNPAGDFLATMDLENPSNIMKSVNSLDAITSGKSENASRPIIEIFLDIILILADMESQLVASLLFKAGILSICQLISEFETNSTVVLAQRICSSILSLCKDSKKVLLQSSNLILLSGILRYTKDEASQRFALDEMYCLIPSCPGNDFIRLLDRNGGILQLLHDQMSLKTSISPNAIRLIEELAKRTVKCGSYRVLPTGNKIPKGYDWGCFDKEMLENVLYRKHCLVDYPTPNDEFDVACFSKGFLKPSALTKSPDHGELKPAKQQDSIIKETKEGETVKKNESLIEPAPHAPEVGDIIDEDEGSIQVNEVYDSTPAEHIRASRVLWLAIGENERTNWEQTSTDLSVSIKVPQGTTTDEVSVEILSSSITVRLKWYGKVLHGDLFDRVKSKECTWCLLDDEIQLVLPKDSREHWWKTLIKGWKEKGYYDILKDAVDADEPHVSYDDMDESAKDLLDSMLERQAYINAGMLDLENSFDDFRIVLSDSSLQGGGASSS